MVYIALAAGCGRVGYDPALLHVAPALICPSDTVRVDWAKTGQSQSVTAVPMVVGDFSAQRGTRVVALSQTTDFLLNSNPPVSQRVDVFQGTTRLTIAFCPDAQINVTAPAGTPTDAVVTQIKNVDTPFSITVQVGASHATLTGINDVESLMPGPARVGNGWNIRRVEPAGPNDPPCKSLTGPNPTYHVEVMLGCAGGG